VTTITAKDLREQIHQAPDILEEPVEVPEWSVTVLVRGLSGHERDAFENSLLLKKKKGKPEIETTDIRAKLAVQSTYTLDGKERVFSASDIDWLTNKSARALQRIVGVAQRLSGITDEDVEELAKNSLSETSDASGSS